MIRLLKTALVLGSVALIASCGPLISFGDTEPDVVYSLRYSDTGSKDPTGPRIFVSEPSFADGLGGRGVRVRLDDYELTSVSNVRWSTDVSGLLRDYTVLALRDQAGAQMLGEDTLDVSTKCRLNLYVWDMAFVPGSTSADDAVTMRLEFSLVNIESGSLISRHIASFDHPVTGTAKGITTGFNDGLKGLMEKVGSLWLKENMSPCST